MIIIQSVNIIFDCASQVLRAIDRGDGRLRGGHADANQDQI